MYLSQYRLVDIYFILWFIIINIIFLLKLSQVWPLGTPSSWCLCPFLTILLLHVSEATLNGVALFSLGGMKTTLKCLVNFLWYMMMSWYSKHGAVKQNPVASKTSLYPEATRYRQHLHKEFKMKRQAIPQKVCCEQSTENWALMPPATCNCFSPGVGLSFLNYSYGSPTGLPLLPQRVRGEHSSTIHVPFMSFYLI